VESNGQKIFFWEWGVKGKLPPQIIFIFHPKIADFRLNYCILKKNTKNKASGRSL